MRVAHCTGIYIRKHRHFKKRKNDGNISTLSKRSTAVWVECFSRGGDRKTRRQQNARGRRVNAKRNSVGGGNSPETPDVTGTRLNNSCANNKPCVRWKRSIEFRGGRIGRCLRVRRMRLHPFPSKALSSPRHTKHAIRAHGGFPNTAANIYGARGRSRSWRLPKGELPI